jgi:adenylate kinase
MNIIILGAPASGKGTQAALLAEKFGLYLLQTGELSRSLAKKDERIKEIVDSGKLIPEEEMTMYVLDFLHKEKPNLKNILFEGFPRFVSQYDALEKFLKSKGDDIDLVISIDISKKEAVKRISSRRICEKCGKVYSSIQEHPERSRGDELNADPLRPSDSEASMSSSFGGTPR